MPLYKIEYKNKARTHPHPEELYNFTFHSDKVHMCLRTEPLSFMVKSLLLVRVEVTLRLLTKCHLAGNS